MKNVILVLLFLVTAVAHADSSIHLTAEEERWLAEKHVVRVRVADFPPYQIQGPALAGISVDYIKLISERIGFQINLIAAKDTWADAIGDIKGANVQYDMALTMFRDAEREKEFALTKDYLSAPWVIFSRMDSPYYGNMDALKGKVVAAEKAFAINRLLRSDYPEIVVKEFTSSRDALLAVATNQADAYIGNLAVSSFLIKESNLANLMASAQAPLGLHSQAMAIRPDWRVLAGLIDKGLDSLTPEERAKIDSTWSVVEFKSSTDYVLLLEVSGLAGLILVLLAYWNLRLKKEIALRKAAQEKIEYLAYNDAMTGLHNWTYVIEHMREVFGQAGDEVKFAAVYVEVRELSELNRVYGTDVGNALIKSVAERVSAAVSEGDVVARVSDRKFFLGMKHLATAEEVRYFCADLLTALRHPYWIQQSGTRVNFSVAAAITSGIGDRSATFENFIHQAELALEESRKAGLNEIVVLDRQLQQKMVDRLRAIDNLKAAFAGNKFELHYQPKVDLSSGELTGFEALLRRKDADDGYKSPADFIPLAEQCGLIVPLGRWVLMEACRQISIWQKAGHGAVRVAVNVSALHFQEGTVEEDVRLALSTHSVAPELLGIELTESVLVEGWSSVAETITNLQIMGVQVDLDDFGTGYSSLSYLNKYKFDHIKIDRSFISAIVPGGKNENTCEAIIVMAHTMGIKIVAEGIETTDQMSFLIKAGVEVGQGYLFSPPMPVASIGQAIAGKAGGQMKNLLAGKYAGMLNREESHFNDLAGKQERDGSLVNASDVRVLIVDDARYTVMLLEHVLHSAGFVNISSTCDALAVEGMLADFKPDLILLDLRMPNLDGFQLMEKIRAYEGTRASSVVVLSAAFEPELKEKALQAGAQDFISKPFVNSELIARLRNVVLAAHH